jgi:hypothetical protein
LLEAYVKSDVATALYEELETFSRESAAGQPVAGHGLPDVATEAMLLRGHKRAGWGTQFRILSGRAFKNLYRDPALLTAHYLSSIVLASMHVSPKSSHCQC